MINPINARNPIPPSIPPITGAVMRRPHEEIPPAAVDSTDCVDDAVALVTEVA